MCCLHLQKGLLASSDMSGPLKIKVWQTLFKKREMVRGVMKMKIPCEMIDIKKMFSHTFILGYIKNVDSVIR